MKLQRSSGILLHITSLPSAYGIGDLGENAYTFIDFLNESGQKYWQILPLTPTEFQFGNSPYSGPSAFAGNVLLISPDKLVEEGYLSKSDLKPAPNFSADQVDYKKVIDFKRNLLDKAWSNFKNITDLQLYKSFCEKNQFWLEDYSLYMALKNQYDQKSWVDWPGELRSRKNSAIKEAKTELIEVIEKENFLQFLFFHQWNQLKVYSHKKKVNLIGDIPFYVSHDSADCWANSKYFKLDKECQPKKLSGVPPDYFSNTGQLWGTPVYDWEKLKKNDFNWWVERIQQNLELFDIVRFDHFRAFSACWEVPAGDETAENGEWEKSPGKKFFKHVKKQFPDMPFIAEDLGSLDEPVHKLRDRFNFPGMKVLLFAFGDDMPKNPYVPHYHIKNSIVYTGTHDNNTVVGWFENASDDDIRRLSAYAGYRVTTGEISETMQRLALSSVADLVVIPMQDILGLGEEAIMNRPGTTSGNWAWRMLPDQLTSALILKIKFLNALYDRGSP